jgi:hypothetical protein
VRRTAQVATARDETTDFNEIDLEINRVDVWMMDGLSLINH